MDSVIIAIEKSVELKYYVDFRTISLVSHASKIVLKILTRKQESTAGKGQFGFRKGNCNFV